MTTEKIPSIGKNTLLVLLLKIKQQDYEPGFSMSEYSTTKMVSVSYMHKLREAF